jgi:hypothetical protein
MIGPAHTCRRGIFPQITRQSVRGSQTLANSWPRAKARLNCPLHALAVYNLSHAYTYTLCVHAHTPTYTYTRVHTRLTLAGLGLFGYVHRHTRTRTDTLRGFAASRLRGFHEFAVHP